jgi:hypothetical protein
MVGSMWIDQRGSEVLPRAECLRLVALAARAGSVGRLALSTDGAPVVQPVNFAFHQAWVVVRIGEGLMWRSAPGRLVAFETDGFSSHGPALATGAWSVLVRGLATAMAEVGGSEDSGAPMAMPAPLVPTPGHHLLAVRPDVVSGRRFVVHPLAGAPHEGDHRSSRPADRYSPAAR